MEETLVYASYKKQKYYFNDKFDNLPEAIKKEVKVITICIADKIKGAFSIGFYDNGDPFLKVADENNFNFDEIEANIEIKKLETEQAELFQSLRLYYNTIIKNN